jgi:hypothetical protein
MSALKEMISSTRSVSLTILRAIERAFDISMKINSGERFNRTLRIHFLGAEALELEQFMNHDVSSVSYAELFDGIKSMGVDYLILNFIGPNLSWKEATLNESRLTYSNLQIQIECHSSLYHEYYFKSTDSGNFEVPDVLIMFNAGIWGYTSWLPTLDIFATLCSIRSIRQNFTEAEEKKLHQSVITGHDSCIISHNITSRKDDNTTTYDDNVNNVNDVIINISTGNDAVSGNRECSSSSTGNDDVSGSRDCSSSSSSSRQTNGINTCKSPLFIVTSYTVEEAEDDEDTIRAHYSGGSEESSSSSYIAKSSSSTPSENNDNFVKNSLQPYWFWEAEINPYGSSELIERETKVCGREYYANHAWQCFELRPSKI